MNLFIRADASTRIGTGHMMRCLALAQAWQAEGGCVVFLSHCESDALIQRIKAMGIDYIPLDDLHPAPGDLRQTLNCLKGQHADWLVLDGYHIDPGYQQAVRAAGYRLLVIDDTAHLPEYHADILLNQNLNAEQLKYKSDAEMTLLLGTRYVLLRQEFMAWRGWKREIPPVGRKVLVTMGGGDPDNVTLKVIRAIQKVEVGELEAVVVVGGSNPHLKMLQSEVQRSRITIRLEHDVVNMPELMAWADVAVSAAGSTCWELAFMGVPTLVLVWADNQRGIAEGLGDAGVVLNLGWHEQVTPLHIAEALSQVFTTASRAEMASKGQGLVDGMGANRVVKVMFAQTLALRRASESDCALLWEWVNDPDVRASAFRSEVIPYEKHRQWFSAKLGDSLCFQFIALDIHNTPIGQVRFDVKNGEAEVDVSIARNQRGKGYSSSLIRKSVQELQRMTTTHTVHAFVKPENETSLNAFQRTGFTRLSLEMVKGHHAIHLIWRRNG